MKKILFLITATGMLLPGTSSFGTDDKPLGSSSGTSTTKPSTVTLENVTVSDATKISSKPKVTAESALPAAKLKVKDLVVGTGQPATPTSSVSVQYVGVRY
ncbi:MAG: hypothetical protein ACJ8M1_12550, partial [Chthoniobacterales bacterium]